MTDRQRSVILQSISCYVIAIVLVRHKIMNAKDKVSTFNIGSHDRS